MAHNILAVSATSTLCERVFSKGGIIVDKKDHSFLPRMLINIYFFIQSGIIYLTVKPPFIRSEKKPQITDQIFLKNEKNGVFYIL